MDYDAINEAWDEMILEKASALLTDAAYEKFGEPQDAFDSAIIEDWCTRQIAAGWMDQKMDELWELVPDGPA